MISLLLEKGIVELYCRAGTIGVVGCPVLFPEEKLSYEATT